MAFDTHSQYSWEKATKAFTVMMSDNKFDTYDNPKVLAFILANMKGRDLFPSKILFKEMNEKGIVFTCTVGSEYIYLSESDYVRTDILREVVVPLEICTTT